MAGGLTAAGVGGPAGLVQSNRRASTSTGKRTAAGVVGGGELPAPVAVERLATASGEDREVKAELRADVELVPGVAKFKIELCRKLGLNGPSTKTFIEGNIRNDFRPNCVGKLRNSKRNV